MSSRLNALNAILTDVARRAALWTERSVSAVVAAAKSRSTQLLLVAGFAACLYGLWRYPPIQTVSRGEMAVRTNRFTGAARLFTAGSMVVLTGVHQLRRYSSRDQVYRPEESASATGPSPFQSVEGLSIGVELTVRYAIDPRRIASLSRELPDDMSGEIVEPIVQSVIYRLFASYTVREIFSTKRAEIQKALEAELAPKLAVDGILLRSVQVGKVDLPPDYRAGMDKLLAEELETEKMRYTLELKDKRVKATELDGEAEKVRREKAAEAAAREQVIAAKAQEEAMQHVLPFKQKQIEQRRLEAEAEKVVRIRVAEAAAQARRIEAAGEADSRQKLADAEAYRIDRVGRVNSEQMEREGALLTDHPLLIQKTLADKLSDKVQVIIAAPPADGGFIGANLLGGK
jgi:regulator of protease activity HflC (stomatin/prohibitin superfamily)